MGRPARPHDADRPDTSEAPAAEEAVTNPCELCGAMIWGFDVADAYRAMVDHCVANHPDDPAPPMGCALCEYETRGGWTFKEAAADLAMHHTLDHRAES